MRESYASRFFISKKVRDKFGKMKAFSTFTQRLGRKEVKIFYLHSLIEKRLFYIIDEKACCFRSKLF
jgi:hypothetical protein